MTPEAGRPPGKPPTMKEIAAAAGVGLGSVSRVLSGGANVSAATRERVEAAARALHYRPSALGRGLRRQRSDTIGLIVGDIANYYYGEFAQGVLEAAHALGRHVIVGSSGEDPAWEEEYIDLLLEQRVDGIVAFPTGENVSSWRAAQDMGVRIAFGDRTVAGLDVPAVVVDNRDGVRRLTEHLLDLGHERIAYVGGPVALSSGRHREEGYREAHRAMGRTVHEDLVVRAGYTRGTAHLSTLRLFERGEPPTALIAANNVLAEAALAAARVRGLGIPQELSFAMVDDVPWANVSSPAITVLAQPARELGRTAARLLISAEDGGAPSGPVVLPTELIVRQSTRRPGAAAPTTDRSPHP